MTRASPYSRPHLESICIAAVRGVDERLRILGLNWAWLADRIDARGIASEQVIWHWKRGKSRQIGCGVYLAVLEELRAEEAAQERGRR